jgi:hypothetical protein
LTLPSSLLAQSPYDGEHSLIHLKTHSQADMLRIREQIEREGGHVTHLFPPSILHGYLTEKARAAVLASGLVQTITPKKVEAVPVGLKTAEHLGYQAWNSLFLPSFATRGDEEKGDQDHNTRRAPDLENTNNKFALRGQKNFYLTSEYMVGSVSVGVVFVESNGKLDQNTETWLPEDKDEVMNQVYRGLDWWAEKGGYKANLSWTYEILECSTQYEPINRTKDESVLWVKECMDQLGYRDAEDYTLNREFANDLRDKYGTDWAFVIYVVPSVNDLDGYFAGQTGLAWSYLGGPYMIVPNKCNGWGYTGVWKVVAHETGHIFNALDEYKGSSNSIDKSGRLNVINGNHEDGGVRHEPCIMKANDLRLCEFTLGQIGWVDADSNGVFDADYLLLSTRYHTDKARKEYAAAGSLSSSTGRGETRYTQVENLLFAEDFAAKNGWYEDRYNYIENGAYHMYDPEFGNSTWLEMPYTDFVASVKTRWLDGSSVSGFGLMFRIFGPNDSYIFYINGDGQYCVGKYVLGNWNYIADWDRSAAIRMNGENVLQVRCVGTQITLYVNGELLKSVTDDTFKKGNVGFAVLPEVHVTFDDLMISAP